MQDEPRPDYDPTASAMPVIAAFALLGGPLTTLLLWKHGALVALLAAPLGGSAFSLAGALVFVTLRRGTVLRPARRIRTSEVAALTS